MKEILTSLFILFFISSYAQSPEEKQKVTTLVNSAIEKFHQNDFKKADELAEEAKANAEKIAFKKGIAHALNVKGMVKYALADYPKALEYFFSSLKLAEEVQDSVRISSVFNGVASIYLSQENYSKARRYFLSGLKMEEALKDSVGIARCLANVAITYKDQGDSASNKDNFSFAKPFYIQSLAYQKKSLMACESIGLEYGVILNYGSIGDLYGSLRQYDKAFEFLNKAIELNLKFDSLGSEISIKFHNMGELIEKMIDTIKDPKLKKANYAKAISYYNRSLRISENILDLEGVMETSSALSKAYDQLEDHKNAFSFYKKYIGARDSIFNIENTKKLTASELNYEFDKKETLAKAEQEKRDQQQRFILWSVIAGLVAVMVFAVFVFRAYRNKRKANSIITLQKQEVEKQKLLVEGKQKEILDSIHYAKRIQKSLLPTEKYFERNLNK